jgi:putative ABC transport system permease protein
LRGGATVEQAQAELDAISAGFDAAYPATNRGWRVRVVPLTDYIVGDARQTLLLLLGAVGLVMIGACANVANLFLAHAAGRQREIAVRSAIGAARGRIFRQVLTESLLLSALAGALGMLIGRWGLQILIAIGASGIPRLEQASLDRTVLLFSIGISVATGILFGLLPALQLSRSNLVQALRGGTRGAGARGRTRKVLVVAEVAIALVLLVAAGLLGRSFRGLQQLDVGFQPKNLLAMRVTLSGPKYRQPGPDVVYYREAVKRISEVPGVRSERPCSRFPWGEAVSISGGDSSVRAWAIRRKATTQAFRPRRRGTSRHSASRCSKGATLTRTIPRAPRRSSSSTARSPIVFSLASIPSGRKCSSGGTSRRRARSWVSLAI